MNEEKRKTEDRISKSVFPELRELPMHFKRDTDALFLPVVASSELQKYI